MACLFIWDAAAGAAPVPFSEVLSGQNPAAGLVKKIQIPSSTGAIQEVFSATESTGPVLIHIEDAHGQPEAQKNIQAILEYLQREQGVRTFFLEGAWSRLDPALLNFSENAEENKKILAELTEKGVVGGPENFLYKNFELRTTSHEKRVAGYGIEDKDIYKKNLDEFREVMGAKSKADYFLSQMRNTLLTKASKSFDAELGAYFRKWSFHEETEADYAAHLRMLASAAQKNLGLDLNDAREQYDWPMLVRFQKLKEFESKNAAAEVLAAEKKKLSGWLETNKLEKWSAGLYAGNQNREFFEKFYELAAVRGFRFKDYPGLSRVWGKQILAGEIQAPQFLEEIKKLEAMLFEKLARNPEEKKIIGKYREYLLIKKLLNLELSRDEWQQISASENHGFGEMQAIVDSAKSFYRTAEMRDRIMMRRTIEWIQKEKIRKAAIITGGFHSSGIDQLLKQKNISYLRVQPHMTKIHGRTDYLKLMTSSTSEVSTSDVEEAHLRAVSPAQPGAKVLFPYYPAPVSARSEFRFSSPQPPAGEPRGKSYWNLQTEWDALMAAFAVPRDYQNNSGEKVIRDSEIKDQALVITETGMVKVLGGDQVKWIIETTVKRENQKTTVRYAVSMTDRWKFAVLQLEFEGNQVHVSIKNFAPNEEGKLKQTGKNLIEPFTLPSQLDQTEIFIDPETLNAGLKLEGSARHVIDEKLFESNLDADIDALLAEHFLIRSEMRAAWKIAAVLTGAAMLYLTRHAADWSDSNFWQQVIRFSLFSVASFVLNFTGIFGKYSDLTPKQAWMQSLKFAAVAFYSFEIAFFFLKPLIAGVGSLVLKLALNVSVELPLNVVFNHGLLWMEGKASWGTALKNVRQTFLISQKWWLPTNLLLYLIPDLAAKYLPETIAPYFSEYGLPILSAIAVFFVAPRVGKTIQDYFGSQAWQDEMLQQKPDWINGIPRMIKAHYGFTRGGWMLSAWKDVLSNRNIRERIEAAESIELVQAIIGTAAKNVHESQKDKILGFFALLVLVGLANFYPAVHLLFLNAGGFWTAALTAMAAYFAWTLHGLISVHDREEHMKLLQEALRKYPAEALRYSKRSEKRSADLIMSKKQILDFVRNPKLPAPGGIYISNFVARKTGAEVRLKLDKGDWIEGAQKAWSFKISKQAVADYEQKYGEHALKRKAVLVFEQDENHGQVLNIYDQDEFFFEEHPQALSSFTFINDDFKQVDLAVLDLAKYTGTDLYDFKTMKVLPRRARLKVFREGKVARLSGDGAYEVLKSKAIDFTLEHAAEGEETVFGEIYSDSDFGPVMRIMSEEGKILGEYARLRFDAKGKKVFLRSSGKPMKMHLDSLRAILYAQNYSGVSGQLIFPAAFQSGNRVLPEHFMLYAEDGRKGGIAAAGRKPEELAPKLTLPSLYRLRDKKPRFIPLQMGKNFYLRAVDPDSQTDVYLLAADQNSWTPVMDLTAAAKYSALANDSAETVLSLSRTSTDSFLHRGYLLGWLIKLILNPNLLEDPNFGVQNIQKWLLQQDIKSFVTVLLNAYPQHSSGVYRLISRLMIALPQTQAQAEWNVFVLETLAAMPMDDERLIVDAAAGVIAYSQYEGLLKQDIRHAAEKFLEALPESFKEEPGHSKAAKGPYEFHTAVIELARRSYHGLANNSKSMQKPEKPQGDWPMVHFIEKWNKSPRTRRIFLPNSRLWPDLTQNTYYSAEQAIAVLRERAENGLDNSSTGLRMPKNMGGDGTLLNFIKKWNRTHSHQKIRLDAREAAAAGSNWTDWWQKHVASIKPLSYAEKAALWEKWKNEGDESAFSMLAESFVPVINEIAVEALGEDMLEARIYDYQNLVEAGIDVLMVILEGSKNKTAQAFLAGIDSGLKYEIFFRSYELNKKTAPESLDAPYLDRRETVGDRVPEASATVTEFNFDDWRPGLISAAERRDSAIEEGLIAYSEKEEIASQIARHLRSHFEKRAAVPFSLYLSGDLSALSRSVRGSASLQFTLLIGSLSEIDKLRLESELQGLLIPALQELASKYQFSISENEPILKILTPVADPEFLDVMPIDWELNGVFIYENKPGFSKDFSAQFQATFPGGANSFRNYVVDGLAANLFAIHTDAKRGALRSEMRLESLRALSVNLDRPTALIFPDASLILNKPKEFQEKARILMRNPEAKKIYVQALSILNDGQPAKSIGYLMLEGFDNKNPDTVQLIYSAFVYETALYSLLKHRFHDRLQPAVIYGKSMGQFAALVAAGAVSFEDMAPYVIKVSKLFYESQQQHGKQLRYIQVLGRDLAQSKAKENILTALSKIAAETPEVTVDEGKGFFQMVVPVKAGAEAAFAAMLKTLGKKGEYVVKLDPSAYQNPHHSYNREIRERIERAALELKIKTPKVPLIPFASGSPAVLDTPERIREELKNGFYKTLAADSSRQIVLQKSQLIFEIGFGSSWISAVPTGVQIQTASADDFLNELAQTPKVSKWKRVLKQKTADLIFWPTRVWWRNAGGIALGTILGAGLFLMTEGSHPSSGFFPQAIFTEFLALPFWVLFISAEVFDYFFNGGLWLGQKFRKFSDWLGLITIRRTELSAAVVYDPRAINKVVFSFASVTALISTGIVFLLVPVWLHGAAFWIGAASLFWFLTNVFSSVYRLAANIILGRDPLPDLPSQASWSDIRNYSGSRSEMRELSDEERTRLRAANAEMVQFLAAQEGYSRNNFRAASLDSKSLMDNAADVEAAVIFASSDEESILPAANLIKQLQTKNPKIKVLISGGNGMHDGRTEQFYDQKGKLQVPAYYFLDRFKEQGAGVDWVEPYATNTGENIHFSLALMRQQNFNPKKILIVQNPYGQKRAALTFIKQANAIHPVVLSFLYFLFEHRFFPAAWLDLLHKTVRWLAYIDWRNGDEHVLWKREGFTLFSASPYTPDFQKTAYSDEQLVLWSKRLTGEMRRLREYPDEPYRYIIPSHIPDSARRAASAAQSILEKISRSEARSDTGKALDHFVTLITAQIELLDLASGPLEEREAGYARIASVLREQTLKIQDAKTADAVRTAAVMLEQKNPMAAIWSLVPAVESAQKLYQEQRKKVWSRRTGWFKNRSVLKRVQDGYVFTQGGYHSEEGAAGKIFVPGSEKRVFQSVWEAQRALDHQFESELEAKQFLSQKARQILAIADELQTPADTERKRDLAARAAEIAAGLESKRVESVKMAVLALQLAAKQLVNEEAKISYPQTSLSMALELIESRLVEISAILKALPLKIQNVEIQARERNAKIQYWISELTDRLRASGSSPGTGIIKVRDQRSAVGLLLDPLKKISAVNYQAEPDWEGLEILRRKSSAALLRWNESVKRHSKNASKTGREFSNAVAAIQGIAAQAEWIYQFMSAFRTRMKQDLADGENLEVRKNKILREEFLKNAQSQKWNPAVRAARWYQIYRLVMLPVHIGKDEDRFSNPDFEALGLLSRMLMRDSRESILRMTSLKKYTDIQSWIAGMPAGRLSELPAASKKEFIDLFKETTGIQNIPAVPRRSEQREKPGFKNLVGNGKGIGVLILLRVWRLFYKAFKAITLFRGKEWPIEISGAEHLQSSSRFVLAGNHTGLAENLFLVTELFESAGRMPLFIAEPGHVDWLTRFLIQSGGGLIVEKGKTAQRAVSFLNDNPGSIVGLFPAGRPERVHELIKEPEIAQLTDTAAAEKFLHWGSSKAAEIAIRAGAPIVPFAIDSNIPRKWGVKEVFHAWKEWLKTGSKKAPFYIHVRIGKPLSSKDTNPESLLRRVQQGVIHELRMVTTNPRENPAPWVRDHLQNFSKMLAAKPESAQWTDHEIVHYFHETMPREAVGHAGWFSSMIEALDEKNFWIHQLTADQTALIKLYKVYLRFEHSDASAVPQTLNISRRKFTGLLTGFFGWMSASELASVPGVSPNLSMLLPRKAVENLSGLVKILASGHSPLIALGHSAVFKWSTKHLGLEKAFQVWGSRNRDSLGELWSYAEKRLLLGHKEKLTKLPESEKFRQEVLFTEWLRDILLRQNQDEIEVDLGEKKDLVADIQSSSAPLMHLLQSGLKLFDALSPQAKRGISLYLAREKAAGGSLSEEKFFENELNRIQQRREEAGYTIFRKWLAVNPWFEAAARHVESAVSPDPAIAARVDAGLNNYREKFLAVELKDLDDQHRSAAAAGKILRYVQPYMLSFQQRTLFGGRNEMRQDTVSSPDVLAAIEKQGNVPAWFLHQLKLGYPGRTPFRLYIDYEKSSRFTMPVKVLRAEMQSNNIAVWIEYDTKPIMLNQINWTRTEDLNQEGHAMWDGHAIMPPFAQRTTDEKLRSEMRAPEDEKLISEESIELIKGWFLWADPYLTDVWADIEAELRKTGLTRESRVEKVIRIIKAVIGDDEMQGVRRRYIQGAEIPQRFREHVLPLFETLKLHNLRTVVSAHAKNVYEHEWPKNGTLQHFYFERSLLLKMLFHSIETEVLGGYYLRIKFNLRDRYAQNKFGPKSWMMSISADNLDQGFPRLLMSDFPDAWRRIPDLYSEILRTSLLFLQDQGFTQVSKRNEKFVRPDAPPDTYGSDLETAPSYRRVVWENLSKVRGEGQQVAESNPPILFAADEQHFSGLMKQIISRYFGDKGGMMARTGPSAVGKTVSTKNLKSILGSRLISFEGDWFLISEDLRREKERVAAKAGVGLEEEWSFWQLDKLVELLNFVREFYDSDKEEVTVVIHNAWHRDMPKTIESIPADELADKVINLERGPVSDGKPHYHSRVLKLKKTDVLDVDLKYAGLFEKKYRAARIKSAAVSKARLFDVMLRYEDDLNTNMQKYVVRKVLWEEAAKAAVRDRIISEEKDLTYEQAVSFIHSLAEKGVPEELQKKIDEQRNRYALSFWDSYVEYLNDVRSAGVRADWVIDLRHTIAPSIVKDMNKVLRMHSIENSTVININEWKAQKRLGHAISVASEMFGNLEAGARNYESFLAFLDQQHFGSEKERKKLALDLAAWSVGLAFGKAGHEAEAEGHDVLSLPQSWFLYYLAAQSDYSYNLDDVINKLKKGESMEWMLALMLVPDALQFFEAHKKRSLTYKELYERFWKSMYAKYQKAAGEFKVGTDKYVVTAQEPDLNNPMVQHLAKQAGVPVEQLFDFSKPRPVRLIRLFNPATRASGEQYVLTPAGFDSYFRRLVQMIVSTDEDVHETRGELRTVHAAAAETVKNVAAGTTGYLLPVEFAASMKRSEFRAWFAAAFPETAKRRNAEEKVRAFHFLNPAADTGDGLILGADLAMDKKFLEAAKEKFPAQYGAVLAHSAAEAADIQRRIDVLGLKNMRAFDNAAAAKAFAGRSGLRLRGWLSPEDGDMAQQLKQAVPDTEILSMTQIHRFYQALSLDRLARDIASRFMVLASA